MGSRNSCFFAAILTGAAFAGVPAVSGAQSETVVLVLLQNQAGVSEGIAAKARDEVVRLYGLIGVDVQFVASVTPPDTRLRVIALVSWQLDDRVVPDSALGVTYSAPDRRSQIAYVFWRCVTRSSQKFTASLPMVLAVAIAHELGHMLSPDGSHAKRGLMEAAWNANHIGAASVGLLHFSPESAALIRRGVMNGAAVVVSGKVPESER